MNADCFIESFSEENNEDFIQELYELNMLHNDIALECIICDHYRDLTKDCTILTESFHNIIDKMIKWIKTFIEKIKKFFHKIMMKINSYFMNLSKFCTEYKEELSELKGIHFNIRGFIYTFHETPNTTELENIVYGYNNFINDIKNSKRDDIQKVIDKELMPDRINEMRGNILGTKEPIVEEDYLKEVKKYYRNGEETDIELTIDDSFLNQIISNVPKLEKQKKEAEVTKEKMLKLLYQVENFFEKKVTIIYNEPKSVVVNKLSLDKDKSQANISSSEKISYSDEIYNNLEKLIKFKFEQTHQVCSIINTALSERLLAYKEALILYRKILQKSIFQPKKDS